MYVLTLLRNGAVVAGDDKYAAAFRERCLEQAYLRLSEDVIPQMIADGCLASQDGNTHLLNLMDVSAMLQKRVIVRGRFEGDQ